MDPTRYVISADGKKRHTPEYGAWSRMLRRCNNPNHSTYATYGGRGIAVCDRWRSFDFFLLDVGPRPHPKAELDRIDTNGPYSPHNCRWVTHQANTNNTRRNVWLDWNGRRQTISQWARELGMRPNVINRRIRDGWDTARALGTLSKANVYLEYKGRRQTLADWSRETGISRCVLSHRLARDETAEQVLRPTRPKQCPILEWNGKRQGIAAWSREVGLPQSVIGMRVQRLGWSIERALTIPVRKWPTCRPEEASPVTGVLPLE